MSNIVILTGPMRSGTTLLGNCLHDSYHKRERHPRLSFADDTFVDLRKLADELRQAGSGSDDCFLMDPDGSLPVNKELIDGFYENAPSFPEGFVAAIKAHAKVSQEPDVLGFKNTGLMSEFDLVKRYFPSAKLIIMVRDPRDIFISYHIRAKKFAEGEDRERYYYLSYHNASFLNSYVRFAEKYSADEVMFVKYEDVVADPQQEIKKVLDFSGLSYDQFDWAFLDSNDVISNSSFSSLGPDDVKRNSKISSSSIGRYKKNMSKFEIYAVEMLTRPVMKKFGYKRSYWWHPQWKKRVVSEILPNMLKHSSALNYYADPDFSRLAKS